MFNQPQNEVEGKPRHQKVVVDYKDRLKDMGLISTVEQFF